MSVTVPGLRAIGILAHIDAGKTSLTERLLLVSGERREAGAVDEGTTATDYLPVERERGITVKAAAVRLPWGGVGIELVDTPGHVDFGFEVDRSLRAIDGVLLLVCGVAGIQSRTEALWRACDARRLPRLVFVNKLDRPGASFARALAELRSILSPAACALQLPWFEGGRLAGLVDLVSGRAWELRDPAEESLPPRGAARADGAPRRGLQSAALPPGAVAGEVAAARAELIARLADGDEVLATWWLEERDPPEELIRSSIREATRSGRLVPVLCGSAFSDGAASLLLDAVVDWLPAPGELGPLPGTGPEGEPAGRSFDPEAPFSAYVFKTSLDARAGRLSWARIVSGRARPGLRLLDGASGDRQTLGKVFAIRAELLESIPEAGPGEIAALALAGDGRGGRRGASRAPGSTGSTLCDPAAPISYEAVGPAEPVVSAALEPRRAADLELLKAGLPRLLEEDPSLSASVEEDTGRVTLSGSGELHLEVALARLREDSGASIRLGKPGVSYREALRGEAGRREELDLDLGGERLRGLVALSLSPAPRGGGRSLDFAPGLRPGPGIAEALGRGIDSALGVGPAAGFPVPDVRVLVGELVLPAGRKGEILAETGAARAARHCLASAGCALLEPWMRLEATLPEAELGEATRLVAAREGRIESVEDEGPDKLLSALLPLARLFGFAAELRSVTGGRAAFQARFESWEPVRGRT